MMLLKEILEVLCVNEKIKVDAINNKRIKREIGTVNNFYDRVIFKEFENNKTIHIYVENNTTVILIKE